MTLMLPGPLRAWWNTREAREQKLLVAGAVFAALASVYLLIYPVLTLHMSAVKELQTADGDYLWLKEQVRVLEAMRSDAGGALPVYLALGAAEEKISGDLKKKKLDGKVEIDSSEGKERIKVTLTNGKGRDVMKWLEELANSGYTVFSLSLKNVRGDLSGTVVIEV